MPTIHQPLLSFLNGAKLESEENSQPYRVYLGGVRPNPNYSGNQMSDLPFLVEIFARLRDSITPAKSKEELEKCIHGVMSLVQHEIRRVEEEEGDVQLPTRDITDEQDARWTEEHGR